MHSCWQYRIENLVPVCSFLRIGDLLWPCCMHLHFANLIDQQITDVRIMGSNTFEQNPPWKPWCRFPIVEEDLLLYLAVLGGKTYSGYYDYQKWMDHLTFRIFVEYLKGKELSGQTKTYMVGKE